VGNRNINREMIDEGWAWAYRHDLDIHHDKEYIQAEEQARAKRLGLWQQENPQSPRTFRNLMRLKSWFTLPYP
jgi:endonuclease YncB( thermonuclease family)